MFCIIYEFKVKPACEEEFRQVWQALTKTIMEHQGGLGSRLHVDVCDNTRMVAYAQWKSQQAWEERPAFTEAQAGLSKKMGALVESIKVDAQLRVLDDLLL